MFVLGFTPQARMFHSKGDVTITGERLRILTYDTPTSHGASVYNGHLNLRGPLTLIPIAERLAVELSLPDVVFQLNKLKILLYP